MIINANNLELVYRGFKATYTDSYLSASVHWDKIAMQTSGEGSSETYGWLGQFPQLREWVGPRQVKGLAAHGFTIQNRKFESTVSVPRDNISDDKLGVFKPAFSEMGQLAKTHPEELIFALLAAGFDTQGFDGQNFFDTDHPAKDKEGKEITFSNMQAGTEPAWFLLDTSRQVRPIIWQEREGYQFTSLTSPDDHHVFLHDEFIYGVRARVNAGFGLWQLGFGSKAQLTMENYAAARAAMMSYRSSEGRILGIKPTTLVVPPELELAALEVINTELIVDGRSNPYRGTADIIVTPYLAA